MAEGWMADDGGDRDGRRLIRTHLLDALQSHGAVTRNRLARELSTSRQQIKGILQHLTRDQEVRAFAVGNRTYYLRPTPEFEACECDGTCVQQARALSRQSLRRLWAWLHRHSPCGSAGIQSYAREMGWSRSTLYHRIGHLLRVGLASRSPPPHGDRRLGWYEAKAPLPSAQTLLRQGGHNIGQTDEDSSTPHGSSSLGHRPGNDPTGTGSDEK